MNVNLGPVFDKFVSDLLTSGLYQSQSEILREGLRLLKEREDWKRLRLADLRKEIALGAAQADHGKLMSGPEVFAGLRQKSRRRKRTKTPI